MGPGYVCSWSGAAMEGIIFSAVERNSDEPGKIAWTAPVLIVCGDMTDVMARSGSWHDGVETGTQVPYETDS